MSFQVKDARRNWGGAFLMTLTMLACGRPDDSRLSRIKALMGDTKAERVTEVPTSSDDDVQVCSFNISFLGHWKDKKADELAAVLKRCEVIAVQEMVAPPIPMNFPNGDSLPPDPQAQAFTEAMRAAGFSYVISPEDTGITRVHTSTTRSEFYIFFYRPEVVQPVREGMPNGFVDPLLIGNPVYDRVPFAASFAVLDPYGNRKNDFVLVSVHLATKRGSRTTEDARQRRRGEIAGVWDWIREQRKIGSERNFFVVGDMNISNRQELTGILDSSQHFDHVASLNEDGVPTNIAKTSPFDQAMFDVREGEAVVPRLAVVDLRLAVGQPDLGTREFVMSYSDHDPIAFKVDLADDKD